MKVILMDNIKGVGKKDEMINASDGYARNYLFPKGLAVEANGENISKLKSREQSHKYRKDKEKERAENIALQLESVKLEIKVQAGENGRVFGGVTSREIASELKEQYKVDIDKKKILLPETIRTIGSFSVDVKLYEGVTGKIRIEVKG